MSQLSHSIAQPKAPARATQSPPLSEADGSHTVDYSLMKNLISSLGEEPLKATIARFLKPYLREKSRDTYKKFAEGVGVDESAIRRWGSGKSKPTPANLTKIAHVCQLSLEDFDTSMRTLSRELRPSQEESTYTPLPHTPELKRGLDQSEEVTGLTKQGRPKKRLRRDTNVDEFRSFSHLRTELLAITRGDIQLGQILQQLISKKIRNKKVKPFLLEKGVSPSVFYTFWMKPTFNAPVLSLISISKLLDMNITEFKAAIIAGSSSPKKAAQTAERQSDSADGAFSVHETGHEIQAASAEKEPHVSEAGSPTAADACLNIDDELSAAAWKQLYDECSDLLNPNPVA